MNERIRELRAKAQELAAEAFPGDVPFDPNPDPILWDRIHISYEKFAELIVRECLAQVDKVDVMLEDDKEKTGVAWVGYAIEKHFGVEE